MCLLLGEEETGLLGAAGSLMPIGDLKLSDNVLYMHLGRGEADHQLLRDLPVRLPLG